MTEIQVYDRDAWRQRYLRSYQIRVPTADVREGTQPWIDAAAIADQLAVLSLAARAIALGQTLEGKTLEELERFGRDIGVARPGATGAFGFAVMGDATSSLGTTPLFGAELIDASSRLSYRFTGTGTYYAGDAFPVAANSTGPATNLAAGAKLVWSSPPAGCDPIALVEAQPSGEGLTGGRESATAEEYVQILRDALSDPASAGNDAAYQRLAEYSIGHGVAVQKAFTYPCIKGPGTTAVVVVLKPSRLGASRVPSAPQLAEIAGYIGEKMPRDDGYFVCQLLSEPRDVRLLVDWVGYGWEDPVPWPPYLPTNPLSGPGNVIVSAAASSTEFTLSTTNGDYTAAAQPSVGTTVAFYDAARGSFRRKKILSFTGTGPWVITCDTASAASDTTYVPLAGQPACPWSDLLQDLVVPVADYLASFGPGEQSATLYDAGSRMRRSPRARAKNWPNVFTNRVESGVEDLASVEQVALAEGDGAETTVGTAATLSYLQELRHIAAYPKS